MNNPRPPRLSRALLRRALPAALRDDVLADMEHCWRRRAAHGRRGATSWYRQQVRHSLLIALAARWQRRQPPTSSRSTALPTAGDGLFTTLTQDIGYAFRWARLNPGFTAVVLLTLALGIGTNTAMFSVVYGVLFSPLPYPDGERIGRFYNTNDLDPDSRQSLSLVELAEYLEHQDMFEAMAGLDVYPVTLTGGDEPIRVRASIVTAGFFDVFASPPARGRTFSVSETAPGGDPVAVISYGLWQRRFGGESDVLRRELVVAGVRHQVVGVMPPDFDFYPGTEVWLPYVIDRAAFEPGDVLSHSLVAVVRLPEGVEWATAQATAGRMVEGVLEQYPQHDGLHQAVLVPLDNWIAGPVRPMLLTLLAAVGFILLIVCANVGALLLARAERRRREIAIRAALGAGQRRLVRQLLTESLVLAATGGFLGVLAAYATQGLVDTHFASTLPRAGAIGISLPVLAFALGVTMLTGVLFGLAPSLQIVREGAAAALRGTSGGDSPRRLRARGALVIGEVALVVALLLGTALIGRSFANLARVEPGIEATNVLAFELELPETAYPSRQDVDVAFATVLERLRQLPGVEAAGAVTWLPFADFPSQWPVEVAGVELPEDQDIPDWTLVRGDYFESVGLRLLRGRKFRPEDRDTGVIVTASAAELYWPDADPFGQQLRLATNEQWRTVVGVVSDFKNRGLSAPLRQGLYFPHVPLNFGGEWYPRRLNVTVKSSGAPLALAAAARDVVWSLDPELPLDRLQPLSRAVEQDLAGTRTTMVLLACFAVLGLGLGAIGIHGVVAHAVAAGRRDIGIRMALGARAGRVLREVVVTSMTRIGIGLLAGLLLGVWVGKGLMATLLFEVDAVDPLAWATVVVVLGTIGLVATLIPARRALRVDPVAVMRAD